MSKNPIRGLAAEVRWGANDCTERSTSVACDVLQDLQPELSGTIIIDDKLNMRARARLVNAEVGCRMTPCTGGYESVARILISAPSESPAQQTPQGTPESR